MSVKGTVGRGRSTLILDEAGHSSDEGEEEEGEDEKEDASENESFVVSDDLDDASSHELVSSDGGSVDGEESSSSNKFDFYLARCQAEGEERKRRKEQKEASSDAGGSNRFRLHQSSGQAVECISHTASDRASKRTRSKIVIDSDDECHAHTTDVVRSISKKLSRRASGSSPSRAKARVEDGAA
jgi:hypothetical protein